MEFTNLMVAEKATIDYFGLDRIMDITIQAEKRVKDCTLFAGCGNVDVKVSMMRYTYADLKQQSQTQVDDGEKHGMFQVLEIDHTKWDEFLEFRQSTHSISWAQSAALYFSKTLPNCCVVSESEIVIEIAESFGIPTMTIEDMQKKFFPDEVFQTVSTSLEPPAAVSSPFDPRVDAEKVKAAFSDRLEGDLSVLKQKSYWIVVCVLFENVGWLQLRKRAAFCSWVNAHFHFEKPINNSIDLKSATNNIKSNEPNIECWPDNAYRDLAYQLKALFFGKREGLPNGYYVYANESYFLKQVEMWRRKD